MILRKYIIFAVFWVLSIILFPIHLNTEENLNSETLFTKNKFFVQTKQELLVSEATGEISLITGIPTLDEKNKKYKIKKIRKLFELNNGDEVLYYKLGLNRIYIFYF